jgi:hypothetical protein
VRVSGAPPELGDWTGTAGEYARRYDDARARGDFGARGEALWGLVARGAESHAWCLESLGLDDREPGDLERVEDAAGVLSWIGLPRDALPAVTELVARLPDGPARDALVAALPADAAAAMVRDEEAAAARDRSRAGGAARGELLAGARDPFTETIYFVRAPHADVVRDFRAWSTGWESRHELTDHSGSLVALLDLLEPFAIPSWKRLVVEAGPDWTAIFSQGSDLSSVSGFADRLRTQVLRTSYAPHVRVDGRVQRYGDRAFWLFDGTRDDLGPLHCLRVVQAAGGDSSWHWELRGEPQSYEEVERYEERLVARRFDLDMLNRYCRALGIERDDPGFYGPQATLVEEDTSGWRRPEGTPSAQWRAANRPQGRA